MVARLLLQPRFGGVGLFEHIGSRCNQRRFALLHDLAGKAHVLATANVFSESTAATRHVAAQAANRFRLLPQRRITLVYRDCNKMGTSVSVATLS